MVKQKTMPNNGARRTIYLVAFFTLVVSVCVVRGALASGGQTFYFPRLANYYLSGGGITMDEARQLAGWDLIITGFEVPYESPEAFAEIKRLNPSIILLPYLNSISRHADFPVEDQQNPRYQLRLRSRDEWLLKSAAGEPMGFWPGAQIMNPTDFAPLVGGIRWNEFVGNYGKEMTAFQHGWDGIYFDDAMSTISWLNRGIIDINNDGLNDQASYIDTQWQAGLRELFRHARTQMGSNAIFVTNSSNAYQEFTNGRLYEAAFRGTDGWWDQINQILDVLRYPGAQPRIVVVNATTNNDGNWQDWRRFRYAYTSTLMTDAYFSFDFGDKWHDQIWWYDEYDVELGKASNTGTQIIRHGEGETPLGVWRRNFEYGTVVVNNSPSSYMVDLNGTYRKIAGTQDRSVNNGVRLTSVTVPPYDGLVLLRETATQSTVNEPIVRSYRAEFPTNQGAVSQAFVAGSRITITDAEKGTMLETRVPQHSSLPSGTFGMVHDMDHDGSIETIIWDRGLLMLMKNQKTVWSMRPYDRHWSGSVSMAAGDIDGDGISEIVLAAGPGGGPHIRIVSAYGELKTQGFFADDKRKRNGAYVTLGDVNYDGVQDIIVGAGPRDQPWIKAFTVSGTVIEHFPVYRAASSLGIRVVTVVKEGTTRIGLY